MIANVWKAALCGLHHVQIKLQLLFLCPPPFLKQYYSDEVYEKNLVRENIIWNDSIWKMLVICGQFANSWRGKNQQFIYSLQIICPALMQGNGARKWMFIVIEWSFPPQNKIGNNLFRLIGRLMPTIAISGISCTIANFSQTKLLSSDQIKLKNKNKILFHPQHLQPPAASGMQSVNQVFNILLKL